MGCKSNEACLLAPKTQTSVAVVRGGGLGFGVRVRGGSLAAVTGLAAGAGALSTVPLGFLPLLVAADALALVFVPAARRQRAALRSPRYPLRDPSFMLSSVKLSSWLLFRPPPRRACIQVSAIPTALNLLLYPSSLTFSSRYLPTWSP